MKDKDVVQLKGKTFIYYSNTGLVYRHPTKIPWQERTQPQNKEIIDCLVKKQRMAVSHYLKENDKKPSRDYIKSLLREEPLPKKKTLIDSYSEFLDKKKALVKTGGLNPNSIGDLNSLKSALIEFEKESEVEFQLSDITKDFISRFKEYLVVKRGLSNNTTQKRLNSLKVFMRYCEDQKSI